MSIPEIILIVLCAAFFLTVVVGTLIKKKRNKKKGIPACCGDCSYCSHCNGNCKRTAEDVKKTIAEITERTSR